jgi:thiosulfate dehydrogenase
VTDLERKDPGKKTMNRKMTEALAVLLVFSAVGAFLSVALAPYLDFTAARDDVAVFEPREASAASAGAVEYLAPAPNEAPEPFRQMVVRGYQLVLGQPSVPRQQEIAPLQCASCHFRAGLTDGGKNDGFSLVGSAAGYPGPLSGNNGPAVDLPGRINFCIQHHLGRPPLAPDDEQLLAMIAYLRWISNNIPQYSRVPWLEVAPLGGKGEVSPSNGETVFQQQCGVCHGQQGSGTPIAPPLWGDGSFTAKGDMARRGLLARFIYENMPRGNPIFTPDEAVAVAAFLLKQPRPSGE